MIREIKQPLAIATADSREGEEPPAAGAVASALISPAAGSCTGADDTLTPNKRRQFEELSCSAKKIRLGDKDTAGVPPAAAIVEADRRHDGGRVEMEEGGGEEEMEEEEEEDEEEESFLQQLVDMESADISTLQSLIHNLEGSAQ
jgi:hypothetical protein